MKILKKQMSSLVFSDFLLPAQLKPVKWLSATVPTHSNSTPSLDVDLAMELTTGGEPPWHVALGGRFRQSGGPLRFEIAVQPDDGNVDEFEGKLPGRRLPVLEETYAEAILNGLVASWGESPWGGLLRIDQAAYWDAGPKVFEVIAVPLFVESMRSRLGGGDGSVLGWSAEPN